MRVYVKRKITFYLIETNEINKGELTLFQISHQSGLFR